MDRTAIFQQLGVGVKFDLKRFQKDALKLHVKTSSPSPSAVPPGNSTLASSLPKVASEPEVAKSKKKRKRKISAVSRTEDCDQTSSSSAAKKGKLASNDPGELAINGSSRGDDEKDAGNDGDDDVNGVIRLMTGFQAGQTPPSADVSKKKKKKKKAKKNIDDTAKKNEELNAFRNAMRMNVKGTDVPDPLRTFDQVGESLKLNPIVMENIKKLEFEKPTPVQMQAIPVMAQGRNILASAPTGSGKTLAFSVPVLSRLGGPKTGVGFRAVLLSPTRELALQTYRIFHRLAEGLNMKIFMVDSRQEKAAEKFAPKKANKGSRFDVLISTPSRLVGLLQRKPKAGVCLRNVECLVVDESDKLFETNSKDGGFRQQLATIYKACVNPKIQMALFSATYQSNVEGWCRQHLDSVVEVTIGAKNATVKSIEQRVQFVGSKEGKILALREMIRKGVSPPVLVFTESQESAQKLFFELKLDAVNVDVIHAGKTQAEREESIKKFRIGSSWILICTELLGRGMDFQGVNLVINFDFPRSAISYVHRIGRTGRAGRKGEAVTFFTEDDTEHLRSIAGVMRNSGCEIPDHLLVLTEKRKEIGKMNKQRIVQFREERKKKRMEKLD